MIFAVVNQKGGVGKTTTSVNLSAALASAQKEVLLVDCDPQGNATMGSGVPKYDVDLTLYDVLIGEATVEEVSVFAEPGNYYLLPANDILNDGLHAVAALEQSEFLLRRSLRAVRDRLDYIVIDCPPALNLLTLNALVAADSVIIPVQCEYYALEGLSSLMATLRKVSKLNKELIVAGVLRTMHDVRNNLARDVSEQLIKHFGGQVFETIIPRNIRLAEAPSFGVPAIGYDRECSGSEAYLLLADEVLRRQANADASGALGSNLARMDQ